jgi:ubiquinol-cytochrome c reductase cytochrome c1 subunit
MKRRFGLYARILLVSLGAITGSWANAEIALPFKVNTQDKPSLQRGARFYMNYCSGCHSLKYMRYNTMAKALGLTTFDGEVDSEILIHHLLFTQAKIYDPIEIAMPPQDAKLWFGVVPPDLSLVSRSRGAKWIYAYLKSFYEDAKRPFGSNNMIFPDVSMPDVLYSLRGRVVRINKSQTLDTPSFELVTTQPGSMNERELEQSLEDLINFLSYVGEPIRDERKNIGLGVVLFLGVMLVFLRRLQKMYWNRLHSSK